MLARFCSRSAVKSPLRERFSWLAIPCSTRENENYEKKLKMFLTFCDGLASFVHRLAAESLTT
jgi:hypothetical protein